MLISIAEFGDHDPERHTLQYLKEFVLVPKVRQPAKYNKNYNKHSPFFNSIW